MENVAGNLLYNFAEDRKCLRLSPSLLWPNMSLVPNFAYEDLGYSWSYLVTYTVNWKTLFDKVVAQLPSFQTSGYFAHKIFPTSIYEFVKIWSKNHGSVTFGRIFRPLKALFTPRCLWQSCSAWKNLVFAAKSKIDLPSVKTT